MGSLSDYAENALLNHLLNSAYSRPATVYLGLCTADPTDAATGASCNEVPNANGYARTAITFNAATSRQVTQAADVLFPAVSGAVSNITHWVITDTNSYGAGNVLAHGSFSSSFSLATGNVLRIAAGQVVLQFNSNATSGMTNYAVHALLDMMFRNVAFSSPATTIYVALLVTTCAETYTTMAEVTEVTGSAYARAKVNQPAGASPAWNAISAGQTANAQAISFPTPGGAWSTFTAMAIVNGASGTGSNILFFDNALSDQTPASGDLVYYAAGALTVSVS